jgi:hypothetical protein
MGGGHGRSWRSMGAHGELAGEGKAKGNEKRVRGARLGLPWAAWGWLLGGGAPGGGLVVAASLCAALRACLLFVRERRQEGERRGKRKRKEKKRKKEKIWKIF